MTSTKTLFKIKDFLMVQNKPVTPTEIHKKLKVNFKAVSSSLYFLNSIGIIKIISNGQISLIMYNHKNKILKTKGESLSNGNKRRFTNSA